MIYFTSDNHYYHTRVIQYCNRPFSTVEEMNEAMVLGWNYTVKPEDTVYHLGDFSMAFRAVELFPKRLLGTKILIPGNHDFCHSFHKRSRNIENQSKWISKYLENGFEDVMAERWKIDFYGYANFQLCHHPYATDYELENGDKYSKWRPVDDGTILLCGHVHEKWKTKRSPKGTLMINVGVDVWNFRPVSIEEIMQIVKAENG